MRITFITGLPGAGKSMYAESTGCPVTYDLDRLADALDYGRGTIVAREVANRMLPALITAAEQAQTPHIQLIRVTPTRQDMSDASGHTIEIVEIKRDAGKCKECRPNITKEQWNRIMIMHASWLECVKHRTVAQPEERW